MAQASQKKIMSISSEKLWKTILDYEKYPQFVENVHKVRIIEKTPGLSKVEYAIELLGKEIFYVLEHDESKIPNKMTWKCVESNILKSNEGFWEVKSIAVEQTEVNYQMALEFKIMIPSFMLNGLVKSALPKVLENFEKQAIKL